MKNTWLFVIFLAFGLAACQTNQTATSPTTKQAFQASVGIVGSSHFVRSDVIEKDDVLFGDLYDRAKARGLAVTRTEAVGNGGSVALLCRNPRAEANVIQNGGFDYLHPTAALIGRPMAPGEISFCSKQIEWQSFIIGADSARALQYVGVSEVEEKEENVVLLIVRKDAPRLQQDLNFIRFLISNAMIGPDSTAVARGFIPLNELDRAALREKFEAWIAE